MNTQRGLKHCVSPRKIKQNFTNAIDIHIPPDDGAEQLHNAQDIKLLIHHVCRHIYHLWRNNDSKNHQTKSQPFKFELKTRKAISHQ